MKYRMKPVEAEQFASGDERSVKRIMNMEGVKNRVLATQDLKGKYLMVETKYNFKSASDSDWIVVDPNGDIDVIDNEQFQSLYEPELLDQEIVSIKKTKPNEYNGGILMNMEVWDWVIDGRDGKIKQITHDDMPDLPGEHIERFATEEEITEHLQFLKRKK